jgi:hypothetical protein
MTMTVLDRAPVSAAAGQVADADQGRPDPEVPERARRRTFTAKYKLDVLAAYDAAEPGEKGAILRRKERSRTQGHAKPLSRSHGRLEVVGRWAVLPTFGDRHDTLMSRSDTPGYGRSRVV